MTLQERGSHGVAARRRGCDLCGSPDLRDLFAQRFLTFDDRSSFDGYDVVACRACGFLYADGIPAQEVFDRYYREMSKYEAHASDGAISATTAANYSAIVAEIAESRADRTISILDVGSAGGHLLDAFVQAGYRNVKGFDPSPRCTEIARDRYGIDVVNTPISKMKLDGERFDLVLLSSVLEHLRDLQSTVSQLVDLVAPGGMIWFEVPDASSFERFVTSPFQQFSLEHINYFTEATLNALLAAHGFEPVRVWSAVRSLGVVDDPALDGLYRRRNGASTSPRVRDEAGPAAMLRYVSASHALETALAASLQPLVESQEPIVVWGTGTLALHLLRVSSLARLNVVAFVDSNANYHGKTIGGIEVLGPDRLIGRRERILVISRSFEAEIARSIRENYGLANEIVRLFAGVEGG